MYVKNVYVKWSYDGVQYSDVICQYMESPTAQRDTFGFHLPAVATFELSDIYDVAGKRFIDDNNGEKYHILL